MCHVCGFIFYLCVQLKLKINTRSLSNQALKSAHRSLLSSHCWPWGVFSSWLASRDLGTARSSYLVRVGPMDCGISSGNAMGIAPQSYTQPSIYMLLLTCTEAAAICPEWSKSSEVILVYFDALVFMMVRLFPNASNRVNTAWSFSTEKGNIQ